MKGLKSLLWAAAASAAALAVAQTGAQHLLNRARIIEEGNDSVAPDPEAALDLYLEASDSGSLEATSYAGFLLYRRGATGRGLALMRRAADLGDAKAANNLGYLLAWPPDGSQPDYRQAQRWLGIAASQGLALAQAQLADLIAAGLGSQPDTARAEALYAAAARAGVADAQLKMIVLKDRQWQQLTSDSALRLGLDLYTHRAPAAGVRLFEIAARDSLPQALALLGDAYSRAQGVAYDYDKSKHYFWKAAIKGNPSAQFIVAEILDLFPDALDTVRYLPPGANAAAYWYDAAASNGITDAAQAVRRLLSTQ